MTATLQVPILSSVMILVSTLAAGFTQSTTPRLIKSLISKVRRIKQLVLASNGAVTTYST